MPQPIDSTLKKRGLSPKNNRTSAAKKNHLPNETELSTKLKKFNISQGCYDNWKQLLQAKRYLEHQINQIILRPYPTPTVQTLLELHDRLITLGFEHAQLTILVNARSNGLTTLIEHVTSLPVADNTSQLREELIRIVAHNGGANNLTAFIDYWKSLPETEKTPQLRQELIRILAYGGGANNLKRLNDYWESLPNAEKTPPLRQALIRIVAHHGGANNLTAFIDHWTSLPETEKTPQLRQELIRVVAHSGGSKNLTAFIDHWTSLPETEKTPKLRQELMHVAAHRNGSKNLATFVQYVNRRSRIVKRKHIKFSLILQRTRKIISASSRIKQQKNSFRNSRLKYSVSTSGG